MRWKNQTTSEHKTPPKNNNNNQLQQQQQTAIVNPVQFQEMHSVQNRHSTMYRCQLHTVSGDTLKGQKLHCNMYMYLSREDFAWPLYDLQP